MKIFAIVTRVDLECLQRTLYGLKSQGRDCGSCSSSIERIAKGDFVVSLHNQECVGEQGLNDFTARVLLEFEEIGAKVLFNQSYRFR